MTKSKILRLFFIVCVPLSLLLVFNGCIGYLVKSGYGQMQILTARRPIQEVIQSEKTDENTKKKLRHVLKVQKYAEEVIGLNLAGSFTKYSIINRDAAAYNVSACEELSFTPKTWWFPIVGRVPYLGFFSRKEAEDLSRELEGEGWDTVVSDVSAYSTLGWFDDPLLSSQLNYPDWYLTRLVIHEATHSTVWIPGDVTFNESMASFVEEAGSLQYYQDTEGKDSMERKKTLLRESEILQNIFQKYAEKLNSVYRSSLSEIEKRQQKNEIIQNLKKEIQSLSGSFKVLKVDYYLEKNYNNAHFMSYLRYGSGQKYFEGVYTICKKNWQCFFREMEKLKKISPEDRGELLKNDLT